MVNNFVFQSGNFLGLSRLLEQIKAKLARFIEASALMEKTLSSIEDYKSLLDALISEVVDLYVFDADQDSAETAVAVSDCFLLQSTFCGDLVCMRGPFIKKMAMNLS